MKNFSLQTVTLQKIIGGGQTMGELPSGKKIFVWGGLPGEEVEVRVQKQRSGYAEGVVESVLTPSPERIAPRDTDSYLSTSPWQIMPFAIEQQAKADLIAEAFELHHIQLPETSSIYSDDQQYEYRNKVEFSWWWDTEHEQLDLAFFRRGTKGKMPVIGTSLARPEISNLASAIRDLLRTKSVEGRSLKTLMIRTDQHGNCVWQLYVRDKLSKLITEAEAALLPAQGGEIIYSDPKSPASRITERLIDFGDIVLRDEILGKPFRYAAESFFQINLPVYETVLRDMRRHIEPGPVVDLYSGVGSIGLSIAGDDATLVEIDANAHREMLQNIADQSSGAVAVLAPTEKALEYIVHNATIIVDPPRAGLHQAVIDRLLQAKPAKIIYLSCNPVTQARDVALLMAAYEVIEQQGYNFFPRTPHIEHLVVLIATQ